MWTIRLAMAMAFLQCPGCATPPHSVGLSPTSGLSLDMLVRDAGQSNSLYRVKTDGTIEWAGGYDAANRKPTWKGSLTPADIETLDAALLSNGWFDGTPKTDPEAAGANAKHPEYEARLRSPRGNRRYHIKGASAQMEAVRGVLEGFARRRHDAFLESLPKPGVQKRSGE